jgi:hypothetical protein
MAKVKIYLFPDEGEKSPLSIVHFTCEEHLVPLMETLVKETKLIRVSDFQIIANVLATQGTKTDAGQWVIVYKDGAYEGSHGSGFPCYLLSEAGKFATKQAAEEHALSLVDVKEIKQL